MTGGLEEMGCEKEVRLERKVSGQQPDIFAESRVYTTGAHANWKQQMPSAVPAHLNYIVNPRDLACVMLWPHIRNSTCSLQIRSQTPILNSQRMVRREAPSSPWLFMRPTNRHRGAQVLQQRA